MSIWKRGIIKRGIAVGLMALMACVNPLQTLSPASGGAVAKAAGKDAPYVGEVRLAVDDKADNAKKALTDAGYEVVDQDLNEEAGSFWNDLGDQAVYMGIKRTDDEDKAIRDMKTMNMLGKYSYADLKTRLEESRSQAKETFKKLNTAIREYAKNYKAGDVSAIQAYDLLNRYREDDSGKLIGDLFLENNSEDQLLKILVEGNIYNISMIGKDLTYGVEEATDDGKTWIDRLSKVTSYNAVVKKYAKEMYGTENVIGEKKEKVERAVESDLDETARTILRNWVDFRGTFVNTEDLRKEAMDLMDEDIEDIDFISLATDVTGVSAADYSKHVKYGKKTLYDLFTLPETTFEKNIKNLYPLVYAMSEGQRAMADTLVISDLFQAALARAVAREKKEELKEKQDEIRKNVLSDDPISVYEGVDREQFSDNAAMTSRATANMTAGDPEKEATERVTREWFNTALGLTIFGACGTALGAGLWAWSSNALKEEAAFYANVKDFAKDLSPLEQMDWELTQRDFDMHDAAMERYASDVGFSKFLTWGFLIMAIASAVVAVVQYIKLKKSEHNIKQLPIPEVLVDYDTENEAGRYVTYHAVKWNKTRKLQDGEKSSDRADRGDLNGDAAKEWLALYTTTDKTMGDPILADGITARVGDNKMPAANENGAYVPLTMFGQAGIQNLVDAAYSYNDDVGGIYLWYQKAVKAAGKDDLIDDTDKEDQAGEPEAPTESPDAVSGSAADVTGSNIGGGSMAIGITGGAVGGFIIGMLCMYFYRKKKVSIETEKR